MKGDQFNNGEIIEFKEDGKYVDKMCTYDEFLNRQKLGDCVRIACAVSKAFPKVKIFSCEVIDASGYLCTHYQDPYGHIPLSYPKAQAE